MKVSILIPARMAATRFPGKPLIKIHGKPMIQHVYERALAAQADTVIVATDSREVFECVQAFGGEVSMTRSDHENGTQRIAELARNQIAELVINVQGDEPCIDPGTIKTVIKQLTDRPELEMATLASPITEREDLYNPNIVKLVRDKKNCALYFSRAPIPYRKHLAMKDPYCPSFEAGTHLRHIGVYGYRRTFLLQYVEEPECELEQIEGLEQLRALYMGASIGVSLTDQPSIGVDMPADIARAEAYLSKEEQGS